jgi:hypothetical protein
MNGKKVDIVALLVVAGMPQTLVLAYAIIL